MGDWWKNMAEDERAHYDALAEGEKKRYMTEKAAYASQSAADVSSFSTPARVANDHSVPKAWAIPSRGPQVAKVL
jgi:hypothetical protein